MKNLGDILNWVKMKLTDGKGKKMKYMWKWIGYLWDDSGKYIYCKV